MPISGSIKLLLPVLFMGFPDSSVGKEFACNSGDPSSIPGLGRPRRDRLFTLVFLDFPGGSDGKESTCSVGNWVQSLDGEDPLEDGLAPHCSNLAWRIAMDRGAWQAIVHGVKKSWTQLSD